VYINGLPLLQSRQSILSYRNLLFLIHISIGFGLYVQSPSTAHAEWHTPVECSDDSSPGRAAFSAIDPSRGAYYLSWIDRLDMAARSAQQLTPNQVKSDVDQAIVEQLGHGQLQVEIERRVLVEAYCRSKQMVRAAHILLTESSNSEAQALRESINAQVLTFADAVKRYSKDPATISDAGDLGYFTVFEQIYPLETAAYLTPVGEISAAVKTRFGYHLVKTLEKLPIAGTKQAQHVLIRGHTASSKKKIDQVYTLTASTDFSELVRAYSEDAKSKLDSGNLGTDRLVNELEAVRLKLGKGEVSKPIRSASGWHILKITGQQPAPDFMVMKRELGERIKLDRRIERITAALQIRNADYPVVRDILGFYERAVWAAAFLKQQFGFGGAASPNDLIQAIDHNLPQLEQLDLE